MGRLQGSPVLFFLQSRRRLEVRRNAAVPAWLKPLSSSEPQMWSVRQTSCFIQFRESTVGVLKCYVIASGGRFHITQDQKNNKNPTRGSKYATSLGFVHMIVTLTVSLGCLCHDWETRVSDVCAVRCSVYLMLFLSVSGISCQILSKGLHDWGLKLALAWSYKGPVCFHPEFIFKSKLSSSRGALWWCFMRNTHHSLENSMSLQS